MNKEKLLQRVEALREAGQQNHTRRGQETTGGLAEVCPAEYGQVCTCSAKQHNAAVDAAAKALIDALNSAEATPMWEPQFWVCGCGHKNGYCLATCACCGRKPGERT